MQSLTARGPFDSIIFYVSEDFCFIPLGSKCEALLLGVHLILLYFISISLLIPEIFVLFSGGWAVGGVQLFVLPIP